MNFSKAMELFKAMTIQVFVLKHRSFNIAFQPAKASMLRVLSIWQKYGCFVLILPFWEKACLYQLRNIILPTILLSPGQPLSWGYNVESWSRREIGAKKLVWAIQVRSKTYSVYIVSGMLLFMLINSTSILRLFRYSVAKRGPYSHSDNLSLYPAGIL